MWGSHDLALNSPVTSVIGVESPLLVVLDCLGFGRKNYRPALSDFCNTIGTKRTWKSLSAMSAFGGKADMIRTRAKFGLLAAIMSEVPVVIGLVDRRPARR